MYDAVLVGQRWGRWRCWKHGSCKRWENQQESIPSSSRGAKWTRNDRRRKGVSNGINNV